MSVNVTSKMRSNTQALRRFSGSWVHRHSLPTAVAATSRTQQSSGAAGTCTGYPPGPTRTGSTFVCSFGLGFEPDGEAERLKEMAGCRHDPGRANDRGHGDEDSLHILQGDADL
jgi:hypothetical protein